ncbi:MAG: DUF2721 domain-containing protein [Oceanococcus sp.]
MTWDIPPLSFGTAGLLFPAISLLMLAYTNRFLGLASVARHIVGIYREKPHPRLKFQVENLRQRLALIRLTQAMGIMSLLCCTLSLISLFVWQQALAQICFAASLLLMLASLAVSLKEIWLSGRAINAELDSLIESGETD